MDTQFETIGLNALIVEDNIDDFELNVYQLKKSFREVRYTHARNFDEYLSALEKSVASQNKPEKFDIILSDWSVPGYDGYAAIEALQRIDSAIPFIVVSGAVGESTAVSLIKAGAYDFVLKEQLEHLTHVILKALEWSNHKKKEAIQQFQIELQTKALQASPIALAILHVDGSIQWANNAYSTLTGYSLEDLRGHPFWEFCAEYNRNKCQKSFDKIQKEDLYQCEGVSSRKDGAAYYELRQISKMMNAQNEIQRYLLVRQDITSGKQAHSRLKIDAELSQELASCDSEECLYETTSAYLKRTLGLRRLGFLKIGGDSSLDNTWFGDDMGDLNDLERDKYSQFNAMFDGKTRALCVVDCGLQRIEGTNNLITYALEKIESSLQKLIAQHAAQEWTKRLSLLDILKEYFTSGQNFHQAMVKILQAIKETLRADCICLYLQRDEITLVSKYHDGFYTNLIENAKISLGQKNVGLAALEKRILFEPDLSSQTNFVPEFKALIDEEKLVAQCCIPIILTTDVRGTLELFFRKAFIPDQTWMAFSKAAAYQIGISLEMQNIIEKLDQAYWDLERANESIIEGLSSALEFRDQETEGHTVRVTDLFMNFVSIFIKEDHELKRLKIGSLLHDIGKIGISDAILNKPGPLTPEERREIQKHPLISKEILSKIPSLHDCIDIPLYHHEKYDGTGYPFGLKGEEIPLSARIFAIVDVYDALISDRPYRKAWLQSKALEYIKENSGTHFDPAIALKFIELHAKD